MHRTTVMLDEEVYRAVKRKAVDRGRPMRALVEEAIRAYLGLGRQPKPGKPPRFGVYKMILFDANILVHAHAELQSSIRS